MLENASGTCHVTGPRKHCHGKVEETKQETVELAGTRDVYATIQCSYNTLLSNQIYIPNHDNS